MLYPARFGGFVHRSWLAAAITAGNKEENIMTRNRKRLFSILLSLVLMLGLTAAMSLTAFADDSKQETVDTGSTGEVSSSYGDADDAANSDANSEETCDTGDDDLLDTGDEPEKEVKFNQQMTVDGVTVRVTAPEGVFPRGASLEVTKVSVSEEKDALKAVEEEGIDGNIAKSYTFDITIFDKDGNELQPDTSKGSVNVSFTTGEVGEYDTSVFHMDGDDAEKLETKEKGETATAKTDGFSVYIVVFTYRDPHNASSTIEYTVEIPVDKTNILNLHDGLEKAGLSLSKIDNVYCENTLVEVFYNSDNEHWTIQFKGSVSNAVLFVEGKEESSGTSKWYTIYLNASVRRAKVYNEPTAYDPVTEPLTYNGKQHTLLETPGYARYGLDPVDESLDWRYALADENGDPPPIEDTNAWKLESTTITGTDAGIYKVFYYVKGSDNGVYAASEMGSLTAIINKKQIAVKQESLKAEDKEYDGTAAASVDCSKVEFVDLQGEPVQLAVDDKIGLTGVTGKFEAKSGGTDKPESVGTDKTVNLDYTNATLTGNKAGNYELVVSDCQTTATASITAKPVTITNIKAIDKDYDGTTEAELKIIDEKKPTLDGVIGKDKDVVSLNTAVKGAFEDKNAGDGKEVTLVLESSETPSSFLVGTAADNYVLDVKHSKLSASIKQMPVIVNGIKAKEKVYDGNTNAEIEIDEGLSIRPVPGTGDIPTGEALTINPAFVTGKFRDANAQTGKTVDLTYKDSALVGNANTDPANYRIESAEAGCQTTTTADITMRPVWVTKGIKALDKVYDGTEDAVIDCSNAELSNVVPGETLKIAGVKGKLQDGNVGQNKRIELLYSGAQLDGPDKILNNYRLLQPGDTLEELLKYQQQYAYASITPRPVEIQWKDSQGKESKPGDIIEYTYDGTKKQPEAIIKEGSIVGENDKVEPVVIGDEVNVSTGTYYAEVTGLKGEGSGNYCLPKSHTRKRFKINPTEVTVAAIVTANNRTYDGREKPLANVDESTLAGGTMRYALGTKDAATQPYTISMPSKTEAGTYYVWYKVVGDDNHKGTDAKCVEVKIDPAGVTLTANSGTETYDGSEKAVTGFKASVEGLKFADTVVAGGKGTNAGEYPVAFSGVTLNETKDTTGNYLVVGTTEGKLKIERADSAVAKAPVARTLICNGQAQELVTAGEATGGKMQYALGTEAEATEPYTASIPTATNVGTRYVWYRVVPDENHNGIDPGKVEVKISPADRAALNAAIAAAEEYYNGIAGNADYADIAPTLKTAIDAAKKVAENENSMESEIAAAITALNGAVDAAKGGVKKVDDEAAANGVIALINALPANAGVGDKHAVTAARVAYDALTDDQKKLVSGDVLARLTTAEDQVKAAEEAAKKINISKCTITVKSVTYTGKAVTAKAMKAAVTVKYGKKTLENGTDYSLTYDKALKAVGPAAVTVVGKGNYTGSKKVTFNIIPWGTAFTERKGGKQSITLKWRNPGNITGYQIEYGLKKDFESSKKVSIGKAKTLTTTIEKLAAGKTYYVRIRTYKTVSKKGYYSAWSKVGTVKTAAKQVDISKCKITVKSLTYTGKAVTAKAMQKAVTVKYGKATLKAGTDYTLTYDKKLKAVGPAAVTVVGKGNYTGSKKVTFNIIPKGTAFTKLTGGKQSITLKWKNPGNVTGYQIEYSLKKDFKGSEKVNIEKAKTLKATIGALKAKTTYYVRIRTYKTVSKKNYYSAWSKAEAVKTASGKAKNETDVQTIEIDMNAGEALDLKPLLPVDDVELPGETELDMAG